MEKEKEKELNTAVYDFAVGKLSGYESTLDCTARDWKTVSCMRMKEASARYFGDNLDWTLLLVANWKNFSIEFVAENADRIDWYTVSSQYKLSMEFMDKYADLLDWKQLSAHQRLMEFFIEKHIMHVDMHEIVCHQKISEDFVDRHMDRISMKDVIVYHPDMVDRRFVRRHKNQISWYDLTTSVLVPISFLEEYPERVDLELARKVRTVSKEDQTYLKKKNGLQLVLCPGGQYIFE